MIIAYELKGSQQMHIGMFETTGFWLRYEEDRDDTETIKESEDVIYKIYGAFNFAYETTEKLHADAVFKILKQAIQTGYEQPINCPVGYVQVIKK